MSAAGGRLPHTVEEWQAILKDVKGDEFGKVILDHINGYGIEYGFDTEADGESLSNAFTAFWNLGAARFMKEIGGK